MQLVGRELKSKKFMLIVAGKISFSGSTACGPGNTSPGPYRKGEVILTSTISLFSFSFSLLPAINFIKKVDHSNMKLQLVS